MKISNTVIMKSKSIREAVESAIKEVYTEAAAIKYIELLHVVDGVGECKEFNPASESGLRKSVTTTYFIPTVINNSLIKVEICHLCELDL